MKSKNLALLLTGALLLGTANATPPPAPTPVPGSVSSSSAGSVATATGAGDSSASSVGGGAQVGGDRVRALALGLPAPVLAAALPSATAACALSESNAFGVGWNFVSTGSSRQTLNAVCVAERLAVSFEASCKYRSAAATRYWIADELAADPVVQRFVRPDFYGEDPWAGRVTEEVRVQRASLGTFLREVRARPWEAEVDLSASDCRRAQRGAVTVETLPVVRRRVQGRN